MTANSFKLCILLLGFCLLPQVGHAKICVLSIFKKSSIEENRVMDVFQYYKKADIYYQAQIEDIKFCFKSNQYEEIIWLSHGIANLKKYGFQTAPTLTKLDGSTLVLTKRFFESLLMNTNLGNLKSFRISSCGLVLENAKNFLDTHYINESKSSMSGLVQGLYANGVKIDISPKSKIGEILLNEDVTRLRRYWLAKSIAKNDWSSFKSWRTTKNLRCEKDFWPSCDRNSASYVIPTKNY
ncbi:MAG: hypothetical protein ACOYOK_10860 [Pseudobdellovibrionaceae bacterium]